MRTLLLALLIFLPQSAHALTLEERVEQRRQQRLEQQSATPAPLIRFGRTVQTRRVSPRRLSRTESGVVTQVVDGSVIVVKIGSQSYQVRTLGSEAPLLLTGSTKDQCYANQSREALSDIVLGNTVYLQRDERYQYDSQRRRLRYVYLGSLDVNSYMLSSGHSFADSEHTHRKSTLYAALEQEARQNDVGLWSDFCTYNPTPRRTIEILQ